MISSGAVRGGGGNFGVVTSFLFKLFPIDTVYAGPTLWPLEQVVEVMQVYRRLLLRCVDQTRDVRRLGIAKGGQQMAILIQMYRLQGLTVLCAVATSAGGTKSKPG